MGLYDYKAVGAGNQVKEGTLDVADTAAAAQKLMMQGLRPIEIKQHTKGKRASFSLDRLRRKEITRTDIIFFTKQMALLLNAGLSLDASLRTLNQYSAKPAFREFTGQLERKLKEGKSLSQALSDYPKHFSSMYINIVRAGEEGGVLPSMLLKINEYQAASQELRQFVISSSIYPAILMVTGIVCLLLLFTVILPRFEILFEGMDSHIAFHVRIMMDIARFVNSHLILTLIFLFGPPVLFVRYLGTEEGKRAFDRFSIRMPILSDFIRGMETSRIFRTLEVLVNNGVHLATALKISSGVAGNLEYQRLLRQATQALKEGRRVGQKLKGQGLLPDLAADLLSVGEESGRVGPVCGQIADHYENELRERIKRIISMIEPLFILIIAVVAGFVVISMLSVILSINEIAG